LKSTEYDIIQLYNEVIKFRPEIYSEILATKSFSKIIYEEMCIYYSMAESLIIALISILFLLLYTNFIHYRIKFLIKVINDYRNSRGTFHLKFLKNRLKFLYKDLKKLKKESELLYKKISKLEIEKENKLRVTLAYYLVNERLEEIPGIGPVLKERIVRYCFDGRLDSLLNAYRIRGIGYQKYNSIRSWVYYYKNNFKYFLRQDFPGKSEIIDHYLYRRKKIKKQIDKIDKEIESIERLINIVKKEIRKLSDTTLLTFIKAYFGNNKASQKVNLYMLGVFPEWEEMPKWYQSLKILYS